MKKSIRFKPFIIAASLIIALYTTTNSQSIHNLNLLQQNQPVNSSKFDIYLRLDKIVAKKVVEAPFDNAEDIILCQNLYDISDGIPNANSLLLSGQLDFICNSDAIQVGTTEKPISIEKCACKNLSFDQVKFAKFRISGSLIDTEGIYPLINFIHYTCKECSIAPENNGMRVLSISENANALADLANLQESTLPVALRFGNDRFFEMNYYEDINALSTSSHIIVYWQIKILKHH